MVVTYLQMQEKAEGSVAEHLLNFLIYYSNDFNYLDYNYYPSAPDEELANIVHSDYRNEQILTIYDPLNRSNNVTK